MNSQEILFLYNVERWTISRIARAHSIHYSYVKQLLLKNNVIIDFNNRLREPVKPHIRELLSIKRRGIKLSEEALAKRQLTRNSRQHTYNKTVSEENRKRISDTLKKKYASGELLPTRGMLGKIPTEEHRQKVRNSLLGRISPMKGRRHSEESKNKIRGKCVGDKSPNWKGGRVKLETLIRNSHRYVEWRLSVFTRDNFTCIMCSRNKCRLNAHHKKHYSEILDQNKILNLSDAHNCFELWDISNGITVCETCHKQIHFPK